MIFRGKDTHFSVCLYDKYAIFNLQNLQVTRFPSLCRVFFGVPNQLPKLGI